MQPLPIPKEILDKWVALGWRGVQVNPPSDTDIYPVQAIAGVGEYGGQFNILCEISEEDRKILELNGWRFWYTVHTTQLAPFRFTLLGEDGSNESLTDDEITALRAQAAEENRDPSLPD